MDKNTKKDNETTVPIINNSPHEIRISREVIDGQTHINIEIAG